MVQLAALIASAKSRDLIVMSGSPSSNENTTESQKEREPCSYCGGNTKGGTAYKLTLMHRELREEVYISIPRCAKCTRRHDGWIWLGATSFIISLAGFACQQVFSENLPFRIAFLILGVAALALAVGSQRLWRLYLERQGPTAVEEYGQQHSMVQSFLADGYEVGQFKRNEDGTLAE